MGCYNLDTLNLEKLQIPGFDTEALKLREKDPKIFLCNYVHKRICK